MREIKFKAWDKKYKKWWIPGKDGDWFYRDGSEIKTVIDVILMQFTGLKDKKGIDIYEDDIAIIGNHSEPRIMKCLYTAPYFWWDRGDDSYSGAWTGDDVEIIGNVWENPELLSPSSEEKK